MSPYTVINIEIFNRFRQCLLLIRITDPGRKDTAAAISQE